MELPIIKIGNSKGLRLSKTLLEKYQIEDKVELIMEEEVLIIRPIKKVRSGWEQAFQQMHEAGDDHLLIDDVFEDESFEE
ncbi:AbrB/MazE/SpoVT family DNA-binding domain-containing protein [Roseivirga sp.]|uniref:AbrB/MazE/SpoVT family DNA-binding domain-containing protein n=1 Tax=Roseivirga sp. TaxID=1964215 RepID=UPI003B51FAD8